MATNSNGEDELKDVCLSLMLYQKVWIYVVRYQHRIVVKRQRREKVVRHVGGCTLRSLYDVLVETIGTKYVQRRLESKETMHFSSVWRNNDEYFRFPWKFHNMVAHALAPKVKELCVVPPCIRKSLQKASEMHIMRKKRVKIFEEEKRSSLIPLWDQLYPFQKKGVYEAINYFNGRVLIADDMGLGKTLQGIALLSYYYQMTHYKTSLVIMPACVLVEWTLRLREYWADEYKVPIHVLSNGKMLPKENAVNLISYSMMVQPTMKTNLKRTHFNIMILDEAHKVQNRKAQCTKVVEFMCKRCKYIIMLSGTPANRARQYFVLLQILRRGTFGKFSKPRQNKHYRDGIAIRYQDQDKIKMSFGARYCDPMIGHTGQFYTYDGVSNSGELNSVLKHLFMIRRLKSEVLTELPPKTRERIVISDTGEQKQAYTEQDVRERKANFMAAITETTNYKLPFVKSFLKNSIIPELKQPSKPKRLIWAHHVAMIEMICQTLLEENIVHVSMYGKNKQSRQASIDAFQNDPTVQVAVLSISAMATGVTLTAADTAYFAEMTLETKDLEQAEDRIHRVTQTRPVHIVYLIMKGTTDDALWKLYQTKTQYSTMMTSGLRKQLKSKRSAIGIVAEPIPMQIDEES
jgi:SWI/SNF-related matrix-associated actin-dependent regulator 1 of chromatin subfamily A